MNNVCEKRFSFSSFECIANEHLKCLVSTCLEWELSEARPANHPPYLPTTPADSQSDPRWSRLVVRPHGIGIVCSSLPILFSVSRALACLTLLTIVIGHLTPWLAVGLALATGRERCGCDHVKRRLPTPERYGGGAMRQSINQSTRVRERDWAEVKESQHPLST